MRSLRIIVAGPQFGEPSVVIRWLALRYGTQPCMNPVGEADALMFVTGVEDGRPVAVAAPRMEAWDRPTVYKQLFRRPDAALLVFTRIASLAHLNLPEYRALRPFLDADRIEPIAVANDARCNHADFPPLPASRIADQLGIQVHGATLGPFVDPLLRTDGMAEAWAATVDSARSRATQDREEGV